MLLRDLLQISLHPRLLQLHFNIFKVMADRGTGRLRLLLDSTLVQQLLQAHRPDFLNFPILQTFPDEVVLYFEGFSCHNILRFVPLVFHNQVYILGYIISSMLGKLLSIVKLFAAFIYDFFISSFLTISAHFAMLPHMTRLSGSFLDVGCGTGAPLKKIYPELSKDYDKFVGVDLHPIYTEQAKKVFESNENVSIYNMDFYDVNNTFPNSKFDFILFSFSFMLMPDPVKAIRVATESLNTGGRIAFIMTLNEKETVWLEKVKPFIHRLTTIDFGKVVYAKQFQEILKIGSLKVEKKVRIQTPYNLLLKFFPVYYVETSLIH